MISHELRTPLNGIIGFSRSLKEGYFGPLAKQRAYVQHILENGEHLLLLINDLLDLSKAEANKLTLQAEWVEVRPVFQQTLTVVMERAKKCAETGKSCSIRHVPITVLIPCASVRS
ncbi:MAG: hypothetical protein IMX04_04650 [Candidatus Carbobacillus altaicus]|nr:hypothetical protein [Candidatus Carbobacillus altaicus]